MEIEITMPTEDLEIICDNISVFEMLFNDFKIISDETLIHAPDEYDYSDGVTFMDFKEVKLSIQSTNNLWMLAKCVEKLKLGYEI